MLDDIPNRVRIDSMDFITFSLLSRSSSKRTSDTHVNTQVNHVQRVRMYQTEEINAHTHIAL